MFRNEEKMMNNEVDPDTFYNEVIMRLKVILKYGTIMNKHSYWTLSLFF